MVIFPQITLFWENGVEDMLWRKKFFREKKRSCQQSVSRCERERNLKFRKDRWCKDETLVKTFPFLCALNSWNVVFSIKYLYSILELEHAMSFLMSIFWN